MSTPRWTPGPPPWKPERWTKERWGTWDADVIKSADGHTIAMVVRHEPGVEDEQLTDNAHLLAAAPELYEALFDLLEAIYTLSSPTWAFWHPMRKKAAAALAKARGESQ